MMPATSGMLPDRLVTQLCTTNSRYPKSLAASRVSSRRQHAGGSEQNARAPLMFDLLAVTYSSFAPNARSRNAIVRDAVSGADRRLEIPTQTQLRGSRRLVALRHRAFDAPRGNVLRQIRRVPARQCTSARRIRGNPQRARRAPVIGCNLLHLRERAHRARIRRAAREFSGALRAILVRCATFRICPKEEGRARG